MKSLLFLSLFFYSNLYLQSQIPYWQKYEPSANHPYGMRNPDAPGQLDDFKPMIGTCDCKSLQRNPDGTWADTTRLTWTFKYIMNGNAIQVYPYPAGRGWVANPEKRSC